MDPRSGPSFTPAHTHAHNRSGSPPQPQPTSQFSSPFTYVDLVQVSILTLYDRLTFPNALILVLCAFFLYSSVSLLRRRYGKIKVTCPRPRSGAESACDCKESSRTVVTAEFGPEGGIKNEGDFRADLRLSNGETTEQLVRRCVPALKEGFRASWWLPNGHAQTIYSAVADFSKDDHVTYQRQLLKLPDGGTIGIDIHPPLDVVLPDDSPVILINHGLTGGSYESYVRNIVCWLACPKSDGGLGGRAAVVNFRGCASTPLTSPHLYSTGSTIDLHTSVLYLSSLYPNATLLGVGFSLGAAVMTRYLGEQGNDCRLKGAVVLCCPLELRGMTSRLDSHHFFPRLYSLSMAHKILRSLAPHLLPSSPLSSPTSHLHVHLPELLNLTGSIRRKWTLRASKVLELVAARVGGSGDSFPFGGLEEFLVWACPGRWVGRIRRPTLAISALDDPIVSGDFLPYQNVEASTHFVLATVPQGGHLGWFDGPLYGPDRHRRWHVKPTLDFLRGVLDDLPSTPEVSKKVNIRKERSWLWVNDEVGWEVVPQAQEAVEE